MRKRTIRIVLGGIGIAFFLAACGNNPTATKKVVAQVTTTTVSANLDYSSDSSGLKPDKAVAIRINTWAQENGISNLLRIISATSGQASNDANSSNTTALFKDCHDLYNEEQTLHATLPTPDINLTDYLDTALGYFNGAAVNCIEGISESNLNKLDTVGTDLDQAGHYLDSASTVITQLGGN